ncbi:RNA polymerase sigma factor [Sphingomonas sp.]|uniref:RNA polymerase sigma factor n=1 Tax=Sphingomonas sp. TaxID=28214 RepID=UPI00286E5C9E|nr:RNA polymerase sigma factor [Sphingomonas sp.]
MSGRDAGPRYGDARAELVLRVARAQSGDRAALERLLRDLQGPLFHHVRSIARDRDLALDALQNSLLLIARRLRSLRDPRWFKAWAYRIATREAVRAAKRQSAVDARWAEVELADAVAAPEVEEPFDAGEIRAAIDRVDALPPASAIVVRLHYLEEMTLAEIAEALESPVGTVKSRLAYGLGKLRGAMVGG